MEYESALAIGAALDENRNISVGFAQDQCRFMRHRLVCTHDVEAFRRLRRLADSNEEIADQVAADETLRIEDADVDILAAESVDVALEPAVIVRQRNPLGFAENRSALDSLEGGAVGGFVGIADINDDAIGSGVGREDFLQPLDFGR